MYLNPDSCRFRIVILIYPISVLTHVLYILDSYNLGKDANTTMSKGRVYSLDGKKVQANEDLTGGMCFLGQNPVRVLFDCGATCSFISFQCVETLQLIVSPLNPPMLVTTATDGGIVANLVCENCPITVSSKTYYIDLVCLPMKQLCHTPFFDQLLSFYSLLNPFYPIIFPTFYRLFPSILLFISQHVICLYLNIYLFILKTFYSFIPQLLSI